MSYLQKIKVLFIFICFYAPIWDHDCIQTLTRHSWIHYMDCWIEK